jgi:glycosyltransferase involved in cell wall biosynthesis
MRVLMLTELYPPHIGGTELHVRNLSHGLSRRGHDVSVVTIADGREASTIDDDGVRVHRVPATSRRSGAITPTGRSYMPPAPDPEVLAALRGVIANERPDIVHAHNWIVHSFVPLKPWSGAKLVVSLHDYSTICAKRSLLYKGEPCSGPGFEKCLRCASANYGDVRGPLITLSNWAMSVPLGRAVDMFVPVSQAVADGNELAERDRPFRVIHNFVPDDVALTTNPDHPALRALPATDFWLYVGTLSRHKGLDVLLNAYRGLAGRPGLPPLVVIGRPTPETPTEFPPNVTLIKDLPHDAVMAAWSRASVGIVPSVFPDPCPTTALEAMAAGVPIVGSAVGGLPDLVDDGETGILVAVSDVPALQDALMRLNDDRALRDCMAAAAARRAPRFMATSIVTRVEDLYAELMA